MTTTAPSTKLTPEEIKALGAFLDRATTRGIREAETLVHLARKLNQMLNEVKDETPKDTP